MGVEMNPIAAQYATLTTLVPKERQIEYKLIRLDTMIGKGYFGDVYRATLMDTNTEVAVKCLHGMSSAHHIQIL